jgi:MFS family permease
MWLMWLLSNTCMWMGNVAAAWMMAQLPVTPVWVALVQAATTLPVLLLALPCGTLADLIDRRRLLLATQIWLGIVALIQAVLALTGALSAPILLLVTFAYGCGFAMRLPAFSATIPDLVPREHLAAALALNTSTMHASRIVGPLATGLLIPSAGTPFVFLVVAVVSLVSVGLVWRWRPSERGGQRSSASFGNSMRGGIAFVLGSPRLLAILARVSVFFLTTSSLIALLPLVARQINGATSATYPLLMAALGAGAMVSMAFLQYVRARLSEDAMLLASTLLHGGAMVAIALTHSPFIAALAMFCAGVAMLSATNSLGVAAQVSLPDWVRARGMAIYQMALLGTAAIGSACWGQIATLSDVPASLVAAAVVGVLCTPVVIRMFPMRAAPEEGDTGS